LQGFLPSVEMTYLSSYHSSISCRKFSTFYVSE
jgi:hypothetical protein